jgi:hypothetical protein
MKTLSLLCFSPIIAIYETIYYKVNASSIYHIKFHHQYINNMCIFLSVPIAESMEMNKRMKQLTKYMCLLVCEALEVIL